MADAGGAGGQLAERVAGHDTVEVGVAEAAEGLVVGAHQQLPAGARSLDHGGERDGRLGSDGVAQDVVDAHRHQSSGSMYRWIVPPHVNPTAKASSSE